MLVSWCWRGLAASAMFILAVGTFLAPAGYAQFTDSGGASAGLQGAQGDLPPAALPGGAAVADFASLIDLIQNTVDPESWSLNGGQGEIRPYPSGVYVDAKGQLRRMSEVPVNKLPQFTEDPSRLGHPWRRQSELRTISLRKLDAALSILSRDGRMRSAELQHLAGLSRIAYVRVDAANEDILLSGPAGEPGQDAGQDVSAQAFNTQSFNLTDVAFVTALIHQQTSPLGCSIEPADAGILAAQRLMSQPAEIANLLRSPELAVARMEEAIGAHRVSVFGMNPQTSTAIALIDADEHMKRVGFGTLPTQPKIKSYFDFLDRQSTMPEQSLIRWWFAYNAEPILVNAGHSVFQLPEQVVCVMSEQQWISDQGRAPTGDQDPAADAFAGEITEHLPELRRSQESYARLHSVFETALALQLALDATGQPDWEAWLPNLCALGKSENKQVTEPKSVAGLATWHQLKSGTTVAVVSGGVKLDVRTRVASDSLQESTFLASSAVPGAPAVPSVVHARWWWD